MRKRLLLLIFTGLLSMLLAKRADAQKLPSKHAASLNFDGIDDHIVIPNHPELQLFQGTLEAWIKVGSSDNQEWHAIIAKELAYQLTLNKFQVGTYDWKTQQTHAFGPELNDGMWHHIAFTFIDNLAYGSQLYLDGNPIGSPFVYHILNQGSELYVGNNRFNPQYFKGCIDEVRIWNKPLSHQEILENYNHELTGNEDGLLFYLKFNQGIASGNNQAINQSENEVPNLFEGRLLGFQLQDSISNFVLDSPVTSLPRNHVVYFLKRYKLSLAACVMLIICLFMVIRIRTSYLTNQNKKLEELVTQKTQKLEDAINQKDSLIQEIHHRVKNNIQFILSMIALENEINQAASTTKSLTDISRRLNAMALVHDLLYHHNNIEEVDAETYITELITYLKSFMESEYREIQFNIEIEKTSFNVTQCISIGMILSELISNSLKYAFDTTNAGIISVSLKKEKHYLLKYADNGKGIANLETQTKGMGSKLIDVFSRQLNGKYSYNSSNGLQFQLEFNI